MINGHVGYMIQSNAYTQICHPIPTNGVSVASHIKRNSSAPGSSSGGGRKTRKKEGKVRKAKGMKQEGGR